VIKLKVKKHTLFFERFMANEVSRGESRSKRVQRRKVSGSRPVSIKVERLRLNDKGES